MNQQPSNSTPAPLRARRVLTALVAIGVAAGLVAGPVATASASETWEWNTSLNCGTSLILTSMKSNASGSHVHYSGSGTRSKTVTIGSAYTWSYYNSGYTNVSKASIYSSNDISAGSRSCDY